jgi:hypothetical protein
MKTTARDLFLAMGATVSAFAFTSCASMEAIQGGNVIGGLVAAPFEVANNVVDSVASPLEGRQPAWVEQARVAAMKENKPLVDDPKWREKFRSPLEDGKIYLPTFRENLTAYAHTGNETYLSRAEQLCSTAGERSAMELEVLRRLGKKAFSVAIQMDDASLRTSYREQTGSVLLIEGDVKGAVYRPRGNATVALRRDLPFAPKDRYRVEMAFKFVVPRKSQTTFLGMTRTSDRDSVAVVTRVFTLTPSTYEDSGRIVFGEVGGAGTVAILGSRSAIEVTDSPYLTYDTIKIEKIR